MSFLKHFEQQYSTLTAEITAKIGRLQTLDSVDQLQQEIQNVEKSLVEVRDLLDQMELSVRELPSEGAERKKYELRVKSYRSDEKQLEEELKKSVSRLRSEAAARNELFSYEDGTVGSSDKTLLTEDQRMQLFDDTAKLERSSRKLHDGYRICVETEQIGADVLNNLSTQRETIQTSRQRLREAEEDLGQSSRVLTNMIRRVIQNRVLVMLVGAILFIVLALAIYFSVKRHT